MKNSTVGDISEQVRGVSYAKKDASAVPLDGYSPVLRANNIGAFGLILDDLVYVPDARISSKQRVLSNDVIVAASSGSLSVVGKAAQARDGFDGGFGAFCKVLRPGIDVDPHYFGHYFRTPIYRRTVSNLAAGANINNLKNEHLDNLKFPLPPLAEQKRIAGILDAADALRARRRESLAQLDTLLQSTFLEMFGDPVTNPMGWEVDPLGKLCLEKPTYGSGAASCDYDLALPRYVRITDVDVAGNLTGDPRCAQLSDEDIDKYRLFEGDFLFARSGATVGKSFLYRREHGFCVYAGYMIRFRPDPSILLPEVLFRYTQTYAYWRWIESNSRAVAQPNINAKMYSELPVARPPLDLQQHFAAIVESVEQQKVAQRAHLMELDTLFAALQQRAFGGEL